MTGLRVRLLLLIMPRLLGGAQQIAHRSALGVDPGWGNEVRHAADHVYGPIIAVYDAVMAPAEQEHVSEVGRTAVVPRGDVVGFRPAGGDVAAGKTTAVIAGDERVALVALHQSVGVADIRR